MPDASVSVGTLDLIKSGPTILSRRGCCGLAESSENVLYQFRNLEDITTRQAEALATRYLSLVETTRVRARIYAAVFHVGRTIVTVGSLIVPALLSIQYTSTGPSGVDSKSLSYVIYWITWFVSLLVTTCNGVLTLFKVDKKYFFLHTTLEQLKSEAWQYIHLSGKYGKVQNGMAPTHANQYVLFAHSLEKIKLKQIEEEYFKLTDAHLPKDGGPGVGTGAGSGGNELVSTSGPPPNKVIAGLYIPTPDSMELKMHEQDMLRESANVPSLVDGSRSDTTIAAETRGSAEAARGRGKGGHGGRGG
jgi:hypothetical protein